MLLLLGLTACNYEFRSDPSSNETDISGYDACVLVTKADAETALGETVIRSQVSGTTSNGSKVCGYMASSPASYGLVHIYVASISLYAEDAGWAELKKIARDFDKKEVQPVSGLGKDAFLSSDGLEVLTSKATLHIDVTGPKGEAANIDAEKALAQKALSRM